jgi:nucleoside-diphosphate-sugar epimerase
MKNVLITGGAGFFGEVLKKELLKKGFFCVSIDLEKDNYTHKNFVAVQGDIRDKKLLDAIFSKYKFDAVFHLAAILAHAIKDNGFLWSSNVDGTKNIAEFAKKYNVPKVVFTSSNCLWAKNFSRNITENEIPEPVEIYGRSKLEGEKILWKYRDFFDAVIIRCPTIIDEGRLGLLAILFDFIDEGRKVWVVGDGSNRYQFVYAKDLVDACVKSLSYNRSDIFNIGSDNVKTFREVYQYVIDNAKTSAKVCPLPKAPAILAMKLAHFLRISPLGPYHYKMIAESFVFDTSKIKKKLKWKPTLTNEEMLWKSYNYYRTNKNEIHSRKNVSAHRKPAEMGVIRVLKWIS